MMKMLIGSAITALAVLGCGSGPDEVGWTDSPKDFEGGMVEQSILNGSPVNDELTEYGGVVGLLLKAQWGCSGVMISNTVVMTAKHCIETLTNQQILVVMGTQLATVAGRREHASRDLALLWLNSPFTVYGANFKLTATDYWRPIDLRDYEDLVGDSFHILGYGPAVPGGVRGTLRYATLEAEPSPHFPPESLQFEANAAGQSAYFGDSGGPALRPLYAPLSQLPLAGILHTNFPAMNHQVWYHTPNIWFGWLIESLFAGPA